MVQNHTQFMTKMCKINIPIYDQNERKPFEVVHTYIAYIREHPPPHPPWDCAAFNFCLIVQVVNVTIWLNHPFALVDLLNKYKELFSSGIVKRCFFVKLTCQSMKKWGL